MNSDINFFGQTTFRNRKTRFGIKTDDRRRHMYLIGKTGTGKTTMMENMVVEDILAGRGVGLIDPHGQFAEKILSFVPPERIDDVVYLNPADLEFPVGFNPLEVTSSTQRHLIASGIMGVFKKIWVDAWSARMEYILNNALLALLEFPGSTLLEVMKMFSDEKFRSKIVERLEDQMVKNFWVNEFGKYSDRYATEAVAAIQNKVGQFIANPLIRNIIGQPKSTINMREIMDSGKIFIANLSHGRIGEDNSALLGAMLITTLQQAAMGRVDIPEHERRDFFLYIDEFQNFSTDSFAVILSEARKYRLSLILAHQYIEQLGDEVKAAVFGNVGTIVSFRVGAEDAEFLEKEFSPEVIASDLVNAAKHNVYVKLMIDGVSSRPFSAENLPFLPSPKESFTEMIIDSSRRTYASPRVVVEKKITDRWEVKESVESRSMRRGEVSPEKILRPKEKKTVESDELRSVLTAALGKSVEEHKEKVELGRMGRPESIDAVVAPNGDESDEADTLE